MEATLSIEADRPPSSCATGDVRFVLCQLIVNPQERSKFLASRERYFAERNVTVSSDMSEKMHTIIANYNKQLVEMGGKNPFLNDGAPVDDVAAAVGKVADALASGAAAATMIAAATSLTTAAAQS